ncbi:uncharacterized protein LOC105170805 [Sesamum indicum]|uniref:Uncharacterized protein LOC105170805 n=1 Tax=Sesamum indicum TaxID=4182 RepID=A0A6I9TTF9_SESIN|nr:uncharacterized protein LOC105170805 [Sesamum indicum]
MLHLHHYTSLPLHPSSSSTINKHKSSIFSSGFTVFRDDELAGLKKIRRNGSLNAVENDSGFEVDPDKAREALRKLDEQLQSLSKKQVSPPKIRAVDLNQSSSVEKEETSEFSGSFLAYIATGLLLFTIFYNVIFLAVIKPSIDGPEVVPSASMVEKALEGAPLQPSSRSEP